MRSGILDLLKTRAASLAREQETSLSREEEEEEHGAARRASIATAQFDAATLERCARLSDFSAGASADSERERARLIQQLRTTLDRLAELEEL